METAVFFSFFAVHLMLMFCHCNARMLGVPSFLKRDPLRLYSRSFQGPDSSPLPKFQEAPAFRNGAECASPGDSLCDPGAVQIAMTLDSAYLRGSVAGIFSVLQHTSCPENVVFNLLTSNRDEELRQIILSTFPYLRFRMYHFNVELVQDKISSSIRQALDQPLNYARSYLADILALCLNRVIYLDSDLLVLDDISMLWKTDLESKVLGAPVYCHANFTQYFTENFWSDPALVKTFEGRDPCYFNTGVMVIDLEKWRQGDYTRKIEAWMDLQKEHRLYELGSLPPFLLVFAGAVKEIDHRWNQHGLGGDNLEGRCRDLHPGPASLLHWSGKGKPWLRLNLQKPCPLDILWAPYDLALPSY